MYHLLYRCFADNIISQYWLSFFLNFTVNVKLLQAHEKSTKKALTFPLLLWFFIFKFTLLIFEKTSCLGLLSLILVINLKKQKIYKCNILLLIIFNLLSKVHKNNN